MNKIAKPISKQIDELRAFYPDLECLGKKDDNWILTGQFKFKATYNELAIEESIKLTIWIPGNYPEGFPVIKAVEKSKLKGFPHINPDGSFCLATPIMIQSKLKEDCSMKSYIENLLIPFLYFGFYWEAYRKSPFTEASHGGAGILEEYCRLLNIHDPFVAKKFLQILAFENHTCSIACPCGSGKRLQACHHSKLLEIASLQSKAGFQYELSFVS